MALIECPDCRTEVSNQAVSCLKCGRPIASEPEAKKKNSLTRTGCGGCLLLIVIIWSCPQMINSISERPSEPVRTERFVAAADLIVRDEPSQKLEPLRHGVGNFAFDLTVDCVSDNFS